MIKQLLFFLTYIQNLTLWIIIYRLLNQLYVIIGLALKWFKAIKINENLNKLLILQKLQN